MVELFLLFRNSGAGKRGLSELESRVFIYSPSLCFPSCFFFFVAFLDQNHISTWSERNYTYKALRWRGLWRKFCLLLVGKLYEGLTNALDARG